MELFWVSAACFCLVVEIYFFFVRARPEQKSAGKQ